MVMFTMLVDCSLGQASLKIYRSQSFSLITQAEARL